jgi:Tol biopolymer transport system component
MLLHGCTDVNPAFSCREDSDCVLHGQQGRCEPTQFCSFADAGCVPSGSRYSDYAGAGLARQCVCADESAWAQPVPVAELNSPASDRPATLSSDGTTLYLASSRAGLGNEDIWVAARSGRGAPFSAPVIVPELNSDQDESSAALSSDGRSLFLASHRDPANDMDLWLTMRADAMSPFGELANLTQLNSPYYDGGVSLSSDGDELFFVSGRPGGTGSWDIYAATRADPSLPFDPPREVRELNSPVQEWETAIAGDGLTIYLSSQRNGNDSDLFVAHRASRAGPFGSPIPLRSVNSASPEVNPVVSRDGTELYFGSTRPGGMGDRDIWVATRLCAQ